MSVDVVCAAAPFLDVTFTGLRAMPALGEERMADGVRLTPGGIANIAVGLRRLGLDVVVASPVGDDLCGRILAGLMHDAGIRWVGPRAEATPVSAVMPLDGDRAFVSVAPELPLDTAAIAGLEPRAVVIDLTALALAPPDAAVYVVTGDVDARALAGRLPAELGRARALIVNESEAGFLTGAGDAEDAAAQLAGHCPTVVVTLGGRGAVCAEEGGLHRADAPPVEAVDTNGAGDLFTAAWVWADLAGLPPGECLRLATIYASMSVRVPTPTAGALTAGELHRIATTIPPNGAR